MRDAIEVANRRAPEHLPIVADGAERVAARSGTRAPSSWATTRPNRWGLPGRPSHVLPTAGTARYASPLGVYDFVKRTSVIRYTRNGLADDADAIMRWRRRKGCTGMRRR